MPTVGLGSADQREPGKMKSSDHSRLDCNLAHIESDVLFGGGYSAVFLSRSLA